MFENFNTIDFIILGVLCLMNLICLIFIIFLVLKNRKKHSVLDTPAEIKVTKINEEDEGSVFDEIIEAMQKDLDSEKEDAVELFEQEQEEKAIISYQELINAKNKRENNKNSEIVVTSDIKEDSNDEIVEKKEKAVPKLVTTKTSKFTNSEFVSPVFGKMDKKAQTTIEVDDEIPGQFDPHELEKTLNIEPLADEIKKNNEFLNALKEFRKNL